jgi:hypothetical protein
MEPSYDQSHAYPLASTPTPFGVTRPFDPLPAAFFGAMAQNHSLIIDPLAWLMHCFGLNL